MWQGRQRPSQTCVDAVEKLDTGRRTVNAALTFIHFMDDGEIQKQLKDRLAARDVTEANAEKDDEVLDSVDLKDFVPHSR